VPYRARHVPIPEEERVWNGVRAENRIKALTALTVREALDAVMSPNWKWVPGYFRRQAVALPTPVQLTNYVGAVQ
jgi:hypothetical protein